jgi:hypothetical protein
MIPVGYMLKRVALRPKWLSAADVDDIYSLSRHVSEDFTDYINYWKHNGYWLFNSPAVMKEIAKDNNLDLNGMTLFYYEAFEKEFDEKLRTWSTFEPEPSFPTDVEKPQSAHLEGYDVTTFSVHTSPECSPLSCNGLAKEIGVNRHCLLGSFEQARQSLEAGIFDHSEPGPFRIFAVYTLGSCNRPAS